MLAEIRPQKQTAEMEMRALQEELKTAGKKIEAQEKRVREAAPDEKEAQGKEKVVEQAKGGKLWVDGF